MTIEENKQKERQTNGIKENEEMINEESVDEEERMGSRGGEDVQEVRNVVFERVGKSGE